MAGKAIPQEEAGEDAGEITTNMVSLIRFLEELDRKSVVRSSSSYKPYIKNPMYVVIKPRGSSIFIMNYPAPRGEVVRLASLWRC
ncbi:MAG: hypothetical protein COW89_06065 [Nitrospinae bacterium CG22_combo_CG10-13_8_21_14_all_47_10]|nr:MAG: hypothetical protein COW89_06065 [Nitrospinae bacterium CG22_combo_CG10-13_8_21_14_all_47_10]